MVGTKSGKIALGETFLAKLLPLAIVIPLFLRIQNYELLDFVNFTFNLEQGAYILAIGIIIVVAIIEFRISQAGKHGFDSLNLGSGLALFIWVTGIILAGYIIATGTTDFTTASALNDIVAAYLGFSILIIGIQAIREVSGTRQELKRIGG